jgi:gas vesicle protein
MTTPVKDRFKTELEQAKSETKQRADRIGGILKDAAAMTFDELKGGSAELNSLTRKSLAELLEELKEPSDEQVESVPTPETMAASAAAADAATADNLPTWKELLVHMVAIVRDRKGDWFQTFKEYLSAQATKLDSDMTAEHGDRYRNAKTNLQQVVSWLASKVQANTASGKQDVQPVNIEVVDDANDDTTAEQVQQLRAQLQETPAQ